MRVATSCRFKTANPLVQSQYALAISSYLSVFGPLVQLQTTTMTANSTVYTFTFYCFSSVITACLNTGEELLFLSSLILAYGTYCR